MSMNKIGLVVSVVVFFLGGCQATAQLAQCTPDDPATMLVQAPSRDCNPGNVCNSYDLPELGGSVRLCADPTNLCGNASIQEACKALGKVCVVVDGTNNAKMAKCAVPASPCGTNNGGCTGSATCKVASDGSTFCDEPVPTGTCSKHSDCTDAQFCNFAIGKCTDDNKVDGACNVGSTNMSLGTATPEQCTTNRCNSDLKCGCNVTADCVAAGFTGLICSNANKCVVDPTTINDDWTEACFTIPGGGTPVVFHSDAAGGLAYTAGTYKGASTTPNCITLKRVIDGSISVPLTSATKGEGPVTAANVYQLPADKRIPGIQLQVCNGSNLADPKCYPGVESGRSFTNEVTLVTFRGLGANKLPLTTFDVKSAIWLQLTGTTSASGNPSVQKASYSKP